jgi:hypothetical protein
MDNGEFFLWYWNSFVDIVLTFLIAFLSTPVDYVMDIVAKFFEDLAKSTTNALLCSFFKTVAQIFDNTGDFIQEILDIMRNFVEEMAQVTRKRKIYILNGSDSDLADNDDVNEFEIELTRVNNSYFQNVTYIPLPANHFINGHIDLTVNFTGKNTINSTKYRQIESFRYTYSTGEKYDDYEDDEIEQGQEIVPTDYDVLQLIDYYCNCSDTDNLSSIDRPGRSLQNTELTHSVVETNTGKVLKLFFKGEITGTKPANYTESIKCGARAEFIFTKLK